MARPLRLQFAGALYHVTSRGNGGEPVYHSDGDREMFLAVLADVWARCHWVIHAYCLMNNHYHLMVETPEANLARGMRQLNGVYTQRFNRAHARVGHAFQGRYKAILVEKDSYLLELARYVVLNPVRAGLVRAPADWPWSSYRAMVGAHRPPQWLQTDALLSAFAASRAAAMEHYARFVAAGVGKQPPWGELKRQIFLGSEDFVTSAQRRIPSDQDLREIPQARAHPKAKPLAQYDRLHAERDEAICAAYASGAYTMREIGDYFGVHYSRVSKIIAAERGAKGKT